MDRLTKKNDGAPGYYLVCSENCASDAEMCGGCPWLEKAINRLGAYEDCKLEPEEIEKAMSDCADTVADNQFAIKDIQDLGGVEHLRELVQAEKDGRLVVLPFVAIVERSLQDGEMKPRRDQCLNGRYAVVYLDKEEWPSPLIDICGSPYNREQAEARRAELTREEAEAALKGDKGNEQI